MKRLVISLLTLALLAACGNPVNDQSHGQEQVRQQTTPAKPEILHPTDISLHLENLAKRVPRVNNTRCVVIGNTAIVGVDVDPDLDRAKVGTVKYSVAEALRKDPYGVHAIVTADIDLNQRLAEVRNSIVEGRPISGVINELAAIVGRIMPQIPRDLSPGFTNPEDVEDQQHLPQDQL